MRGHLRPVGGDSSGGVSRVRPVRVVLADDHVPLRRTLRQLLEREADFRVVAEAGDFETALREVREHRPHVLVFDFRMPNGSSAERIGRLHEQSPRTGIVVITMHENTMCANHALEAGAIGFVRKDAADLELADAVRSAARGVQYRSPHLSRA
ncbi:MAG TPA: response regulator transcription factor [Solirubrobacteraceae bacterium]|nr:response regulator transcription factor [Solirubrobacteraceae bacterium]